MNEYEQRLLIAERNIGTLQSSSNIRTGRALSESHETEQSAIKDIQKDISELSAEM
jgi:hypothetical protein